MLCKILRSPSPNNALCCLGTAFDSRLISAPIEKGRRCRPFSIGGDEGSRTPVRKPIHATFSGCIAWLDLPRGGFRRKANRGQPFCAWSAQWRTTDARASLTWRSAEGRDPPSGNGRHYEPRHCLIRQPEQQYCCRLIFKVWAVDRITRPDPLIALHNPRRNRYTPIKVVWRSPRTVLHQDLHGSNRYQLRNTLSFMRRSISRSDSARAMESLLS